MVARLKIKILICSLFCLQYNFSQNIKLKGKITDSINTPLANANIIAEPQENIPLKFAISNGKGHYELMLEKDKLYNITISYLGYTPLSFSLKSSENIQKDFALNKSIENLDEVVLNYTPPVVIKKDTITYRTDVFKTGEERKLRDVLKKLPGVEVDRAGVVTVLGKKVNKVLVENKPFFTGDSKLAVNNIPADAIDKVEVLDNYNEVSILKGLQDTEDMAMNITLKEDKKKFVFGDTETGAGIKNRFLFHPSLFYYSPKTSVNAIGDFNNMGQKSFTLKDYIGFNGGINKLLADRKSYTSIYTDDFTKFLSNKDYKFSQNQFGAINLNKTLSSKTNITSYTIWSNSNNKTQTQYLNNYISNNSNLIENRTNTGHIKSNFVIGELTLKNNPNKHTDLSFSTLIKLSQNKSNNNITTVTNENNNIINTIIEGNDIFIKQNLEFHKQLKKAHTLSFILNYNYKKEKPNTNWNTDNAFFEGLIPLEEEETYNIVKNKKALSQNIDLAIKHYWELNNFNHIYTTLGALFAFDNFNTSEYQRLEDNSIKDFTGANFGNQTNLNFRDFFLGLHYKFKIGSVTFKPGLFYHKYFWDINQDNKSKDLLLPELSITFRSKLKNRVSIKYALKTRFPQIHQLANRFTLLNFNNIYIGNQNLENERYHAASINLNRFSIFRDIFYNFSITLKIKEDNFKNATTIEDINYVSTPLLSNFEDKTWRFYGSLKKGIGNFMFSLKTNTIFANHENLINNELINNKSKSYAFGTGIETRFKDFPNLEITYNKKHTKYTTNSISKFKSNTLSFFLEYDFLKDFILKADYSYNNYENKNIGLKNIFDTANTSLFYQKKDSPWGFEVTANNLFDVKFKQQNSFNGFLIRDNKTFILPRIIMFKVIYKL